LIHQVSQCRTICYLDVNRTPRYSIVEIASQTGKEFHTDSHHLVIRFLRVRQALAENHNAASRVYHKNAGRMENCPARLEHVLQLTKDRIQCTIRHIKDLVVRRERLKLHELGHPVALLADPSCLVEGTFLTQDF